MLPTHEASPCLGECRRKYLKVSPVNAAMSAVDLGCYTLRTQQHEPTVVQLTTSIQVRHMHEFFFLKISCKKHKTLVNLSVLLFLLFAHGAKNSIAHEEHLVTVTLICTLISSTLLLLFRYSAKNLNAQEERLSTSP